MRHEEMGGPAFPTDSEHQSGPSTWHHDGMALWDYYAAAALTGLLANDNPIREVTPEGVLQRPQTIAAPMVAARYADQMLIERQKRMGGDDDAA